MSALLGRMPSAVGYQPTLGTEMGELQERITSTKRGAITSIQAIYVPADDFTDPAPATTFAHLDAFTALSRAIAEKGIYPAVDPLESRSRLMDPQYVGEEHYDGRAERASGSSSATRSCRTSSRSSASTSSPSRTRCSWAAPARSSASSRSRSSSPRSSRARQGNNTPLKETIRSFKELVRGQVGPPARVGVHVRRRDRGGRRAGREDEGQVAVTGTDHVPTGAPTSGGGLTLRDRHARGGDPRRPRRHGRRPRPRRRDRVPARVTPPTWGSSGSANCGSTRSAARREHFFLGGGVVQVVHDLVTVLAESVVAARRSTRRSPGRSSSPRSTCRP